MASTDVCADSSHVLNTIDIESRLEVHVTIHYPWILEIDIWTSARRVGVGEIRVFVPRRSAYVAMYNQVLNGCGSPELLASGFGFGFYW